MKKPQGFTFFKSYFEAIEELSDSDKKEILFAMIQFIFKDKKPKFNGIKKIIWLLIEPTLTKSKRNSGNGQGKSESETKEKRNEIENEAKKKQNESETKAKTKCRSSVRPPYPYPFIDSILLNIINSNNNINNLFKEYIQLREKNKYTISESIVKRLVNKLNEYGKTEAEKEEVILNAINGKWKDFYPLDKNRAKKGEENTDDRAKRIFGSD